MSEVKLDRKGFLDLLERNTSLMVFKFGASWCHPCKRIAPWVSKGFESLGENASCFQVDIDESFDLFAFLKSKKMIMGIPVIMAWLPGNTSYAPDQSAVGGEEETIDNFFKWCEDRVKK
jgi:thiol-disulfide isomerase/thioredoxin